MAGVNPKILVWARETAGLDLAVAAKKLAINSARGLSGEERLAEIESGLAAPTVPLLRRMAARYRRPLTTFYLSDIPAPSQLGEDFRTLPDKSDFSDPLLSALLRSVKARQTLIREILEDDEFAREVSLVGSAKGINKSEDIGRLIIEGIGFDREAYRAHTRIQDAFAYMRKLIERKGVFVLLAGDCGHWSTAIDVRIFRGFAISDQLAPFIVVNDQDAKTAWPFTLMHELAHLMLGQSGVSGGMPNGRIEQFCNDAAASVLITQREITNFGNMLQGDISDITTIDNFAAAMNISSSMVAYQLYRMDTISDGRWNQFRNIFRERWLANRARERQNNRDQESGPNWYIVRRHRIGNAILAVAKQGIQDGSLTPSRAAKILGVKPMNVYPLLAEPQLVKA